MSSENPLESMNMLKERFHGIYQGIVRDDEDSLGHGRVKVEVFPMFYGIPTDNLPWATINYGLLMEIPITDSWVTIMFKDNGNPLYPVVIGYCQSYDVTFEEKDDYDLTGKDGRLHDWEEREIQLDIIKDAKNSDKVSGEPTYIRTAIYPHVKSIVTKNGIVIEYDDSSGGERINIYHPSGSFIEIQPNGDFIIKSHTKLENYAKGDIKIKTEGDINIDSNGDTNIIVGGNADIAITGDADLIASGNLVVDGTIIKIGGASAALPLVTTVLPCLLTGASQHTTSTKTKVI